MKNKYTTRLPLKSLALGIIIFLFPSCVWKYVTPAHNTPCFTDKKQFEGSCSGNINGANVNLAYSPLKYLSVQLNAYSSLTSTKNHFFNNQLEAAVGGYLPTRNFILGVTAGYGIGMTHWKRIWYSGDAYTPLERLEFETKKYYVDCFGVYRWKSSESFSGVSAKVNFMENLYHKAIYSGYENKEKNNFTRQQYSFELTYFIKLKIYKKLYANFNWGMHFLNGNEDGGADVHPVGQVGLSVKI